MKAEKRVEIVLILTQEEAQWLRLNTQNPLHCEHPDEEDPYDRALREEFFESVKGVTSTGDPNPLQAARFSPGNPGSSCRADRREHHHCP